jgi:hypothetical protein
MRSMTAPDGAQKRRFRTNEPKLWTLHDLYKYLIYNILRIQKTCAQENNTMKNEPKLCQSMNQRISESVHPALIHSFTYSNFAHGRPTRPKPSKTESNRVKPSNRQVFFAGAKAGREGRAWGKHPIGTLWLS